MRVRVISESAFSVQGHGVHTAFLEHVELLKGRDVEVLVNQRGRADITHIHTVGAYALTYLLVGSGQKVVSAHILPASLVGSLALAKLWAPLARAYLRRFYNRADLVVAVSDATKRGLEELGVKRSIEVIHNSVDTSRYRPDTAKRRAARKRLGLKQSDWLVIGAGQVQPRKRVDSFISAAKALPDTKFVWVGGIPFKHAAADYKKMKRLMDRAPANASFTGIVDFADMADYYQAGDIFFLPSSQETFGLVVIEAAAAGLPVVLRDIPDYEETFKSYTLLSEEAIFVGNLGALIRDKKLYVKHQKLSQKLAAKFDSRQSATQLVNMYIHLLRI